AWVRHALHLLPGPPPAHDVAALVDRARTGAVDEPPAVGDDGVRVAGRRRELGDDVALVTHAVRSFVAWLHGVRRRTTRFPLRSKRCVLFMRSATPGYRIGPRCHRPSR